MTSSSNESDPQALAQKKNDFTPECECASAPGKQALPSLNRAVAATPPRAQPHRETLTLKRSSRARYP